MTRVLAYRALGLGDFLTGVPAYRALDAAWPGAVWLAAPEPLRPLAELCEAVAGFLPTAELTTPAWTGPPPDVVVNLHGRGPQSHRALLPLGSPRLVAFGCEEAGVAGPTWRGDEHEVRRWCRLLAESGVPADPARLHLSPPPDPPPVAGASVIHPGAKAPERRWPPERFAAVAAQLAAAGHEVVVTGSAAERSLAEEVAVAAGLAPSQVLAGHFDLGQLAALVAHARLVVCGDTGVAHLATAFGTPSVVLFGPTPPQAWGPPPDPRHRVLWRADAPEPRLLHLQVDDVLRAVWDLLDQVEPVRST